MLECLIPPNLSQPTHSSSAFQNSHHEGSKNFFAQLCTATDRQWATWTTTSRPPRWGGNEKMSLNIGTSDLWFQFDYRHTSRVKGQNLSHSLPNGQHPSWRIDWQFASHFGDFQWEIPHDLRVSLSLCTRDYRGGLKYTSQVLWIWSEKNCIFLSTADRRTQFFTSYSENMGSVHQLILVILSS